MTPELHHDGPFQMWWGFMGESIRFVPGDEWFPAFVDWWPAWRLEVESWETGWEVGLCALNGF